MASPALLEPQVTPSEAVPEEALYEVVDGQRVQLPPMSAYSTLIASRLVQDLGPFSVAHRLGFVVSEMLFILDAERNLRRRPDVAFVSFERWPLDHPIPETGDWEMVPDLAIEVVSPNDLFDNVLAKMHEYFEKGVRQVWIVVPTKQQIYIFDSPTNVNILSAADEWDGGTLLPGLRLPVARLFQRHPAAEASAPV
jgi:Uma2 family endonuclease